MSFINVHVVAGLLALLTTVPYPGARGGPDDLLEDVKWLSFNVFSGTVSKIKGETYSKIDASNYLGAILFVVYVAASLYYTFRVSIRLAVASQKIRDADYPIKASFYSCLSFLSFAIISLYLFLFTASSYLTWSGGASQTPSDDSSFRAFALKFWNWSTSNTPFLHFARSLCTTNGGYWWSVQGLLTSMLSTLYISAAAQSHGVTDELDFFVLAQLLPGCFAQNLFFVAILIQRFSKAPARAPRSTRVMPESMAWTLLIAFRFVVAYLPLTSSQTGLFVAFVLLARIGLFSNYFISFDTPALVEEALPWVLVYKLPLLLGNLVIASPDKILSAMTVNFAVSTLSIDYIISSASIALFFGWDIVEKRTDSWAAQRKR